MSARSFYVTGTDTGIGKTWVSVALIHALRRAGYRVVGMKPVASGCVRATSGWVNEDALALQEASDPRPDYLDVNPFALPLATAPEIAAEHARETLELAPLVDAHRRLGASADWVVVEGVGGWLAPLSSELMQSDLTRALSLPVVLVVGLRLGCINHALLSLRALRQDGAEVLGWVANAVDPELEFSDQTLVILRQRLDLPFIGLLKHDQPAEQVELDLQPLSPEFECMGPL